MKNKLHDWLQRFLKRSLRIIAGAVILLLVLYLTTTAREISTSTISFENLSTLDFFYSIFLTTLAYIFFILIWPISFGKKSINIEKIQLIGNKIKKKFLTFIKMWIRG